MFGVEVGRSVWVTVSGYSVKMFISQCSCFHAYISHSCAFSMFIFRYTEFSKLYRLKLSLTLFECDHQRVVLRAELRKP